MSERVHNDLPTGATKSLVSDREFYIRLCGHRFVLTAICVDCRRYANWKLAHKLKARREARRGA